VRAFRALKRWRSRIGVVHQAPPIPPRLRVVTAVLAGRLGAWGAGKALASLIYPADIAGARDALAGQHLDQLGPIEGGLVTQDATSAAQRRAPERAAGASHRGDQRPPGQDQEAPGRRLLILGEGLHHRGKPPRHVGSVVAVPDRRVQLDQAVALLGD